MQPFTGWAVPPPEDADAAVTVPISARLVMATVIRQTARQFGLMMSCPAAAGCVPWPTGWPGCPFNTPGSVGCQEHRRMEVNTARRLEWASRRGQQIRDMALGPARVVQFVR